jgi:signal transduction histidine kinase
MSRMVADLSDINKIEGNRMTLNLTAVSLSDVVKEAVQAQTHTIEGKGQTVTTTLPDNLPPVYGDRARLIQVVSNVISNAAQYTLGAGVIAITAEALPQAEIHVTVQDNGIGIVENEQSHIFEKFFRASDEETRQIPGNGLALHLSRQLIELHHGRIWFESKRGAGTTFHIVLPAAPA